MKPLATATVDDGYKGHTARITLSLAEHSGWIMCVTEYGGYFKSHYPPVLDEREALWIIKNHPNKRYYSAMTLLN